MKPLQNWMYCLGTREMPQAEIFREDPFIKGYIKLSKCLESLGKGTMEIFE